MAEKGKTIAFRLTRKDAEQVEKRAAKSGKRGNELARDILLSNLYEEGDREMLKIKIASLELAVKQLQRGLANATEAMLVVSGKVTKEQAKQWVRENVG